MKETMTEKEAMRLIKRLEAAGYEKKYEDLPIWCKEFDGYVIQFTVFELLGWKSHLHIKTRDGEEVNLWMEKLKSCRVIYIERMARKMLDYIGSYQKLR